MNGTAEFLKAAPVGFHLREACDFGHAYKYFVSGKGCLLGVLFEDSLHVYFEWLLENDEMVPYGPDVRYKAWPKREFARLMTAGVWEATCTA